MKFLLFSLSVYLFIGLLYGWYHLRNVLITLYKTHAEDMHLREMISMHNFTPTGADYYAQLQGLHIEKGLFLAEWRLFEKSKTKYKCQLYCLGCLFWPYYWLNIKRG